MIGRLTRWMLIGIVCLLVLGGCGAAETGGTAVWDVAVWDDATWN
jgi:hypothetical protein